MNDYSSLTYPERKLLANGGKAVQREDRDDRAQEYKDTVRGFGYSQDVDHLFYEFADNRDIIYICTMEITKREPHPDYPTPGARYFDKILERYRSDAQGTVSRDIARKLGCHCILIVFEDGCNCFWRYDLTKPRGWFKDNNLEEHHQWLERLKDRRRAEYKNVEYTDDDWTGEKWEDE